MSIAKEYKAKIVDERVDSKTFLRTITFKGFDKSKGEQFSTEIRNILLEYREMISKDHKKFLTRVDKGIKEKIKEMKKAGIKFAAKLADKKIPYDPYVTVISKSLETKS